MRGKISFKKALSVLLVGLIFTFSLPLTAFGAGLPSVTTTTTATNIAGRSATVSGNVTNINGSTIIERGVCYSTSSTTNNINTSGPHVVYTPETGTTGSFSVNLTGLNQNTTYYFRAYARNAYGTTYGARGSFKTLRQYTVTYVAGTNGTIVGTTPQIVDRGSSTEEVTATPNTGYHFVKWSDNNTNPVRSDSNVTANKTYTASFAINQYTITYAAGSGGTIVGTTSQTVNHGSSTTSVTATPIANYHFVEWSDNHSTNPVRSDTNVTATATYTATFSINQYLVTYIAGTGGTIVGTNPQTIDYGGSTVAVTATPNVGYHFVEWSDNHSTNPVRSDSNITSTRSYTATFAINQYTVTYSAGSGGTIAGTASQTVDYGSSTTAVTATPNAGYHFLEWSDNHSTNPVRSDAGVDATITYYAVFVPNYVTVTYSTGAGGTIVGTTPQTIEYAGSTVSVTATPNIGYHFVKWLDNNSTNPVRSDSNVTATATYNATFAINQYTIYYQASTGGAITGSASQTINHGGSTTQVTATAATDYHFLEWSDNHSTNPVRTDTNVTGSAVYTAVFVPNYVSVEYLAAEGGWISGSSYQTISYGGDTAAVAAIPNWGYRFVEWSDNHSTNPVRSDSNVTADAEYHAVFAYDLCTITYVADEGGYLSGSNIQTVSTGGSTSAVTAIPNWGYRFVEWSDNHSTNPVRSDSNVTADAEYHAVFAYDLCTITYVADEGGYLSGSNIQTVSTGGSTSAVTAIPNWGYRFVEWSDNHSTNPVRSDSNVTADAEYHAVFAYNICTITYAASEGGYISGSNVQDVTIGDSTSSVTAIADWGYHFVEWSDNHSTNPVRSDVGVTTTTYTAIFSDGFNQYTITFDTAGGSAVSPITQDYGTAITPPSDPSKVGYTFLGWSPAIPETMPTENITITAQWQKNDGVLTITNVVNQSSGTGTQSYLFKIERNYNSTIQTSNVVIHGSGDLTLTQLAPGTYTVTQMSTWSWRYAIYSQPSFSFTIDNDNLTHQVIFGNQCTIFNWLSDVTYIINNFISS